MLRRITIELFTPAQPRRRLGPAQRTTSAARRCRRKFLHYFPGGFRDETYVDWERSYKLAAHQRWEAESSAR
jgi:hypothetical protein